MVLMNLTSSSEPLNVWNCLRFFFYLLFLHIFEKKYLWYARRYSLITQRLVILNHSLRLFEAFPIKITIKLNVFLGKCSKKFGTLKKKINTIKIACQHSIHPDSEYKGSHAVAIINFCWEERRANFFQQSLINNLIPKTALVNLCLTILPPRKLFDLTPQTLLARVCHTQ